MFNTADDAFKAWKEFKSANPEMMEVRTQLPEPPPLKITAPTPDQLKPVKACIVCHKLWGGVIYPDQTGDPLNQLEPAICRECEESAKNGSVLIVCNDDKRFLILKKEAAERLGWGKLCGSLQYIGAKTMDRIAEEAKNKPLIITPDANSKP